MLWIFIALIPPFLWSISCIIDEYIAKQNKRLGGINYVILATAVGTIPGLALLLWDPSMLRLGWEINYMLSLLGVFYSLSFWPYIVALKEDGAGLVVPLYQILPLFIFIFAWLFLGETISPTQCIGALIIIISSFVFVMDGIRGVRLRPFILMIMSCTMLAGYVVITRHFTEQIDWLYILTWNLVGSGGIAILFIMFHNPTRLAMLCTLKRTGIATCSLFSAQSLLDILAQAFWILALSLAPAAGLVQTLNSVQPFYIMVLSLIACKFLPDIYAPPPNKYVILQRIICFLFISLGIAMISLAH